MGIKIEIKDILEMQPNTILWDSIIRGFLVRRQYTDTKTFSVFYRTFDQKQHWHKIGRYGVWTIDEAREEAKRILKANDTNTDPSHGMAMTTLCHIYLSETHDKKMSTIKSDLSRLRKHIIPKLGHYKIAAISPNQIEQFMGELSPGNAERVIGLTSAIFSFAIERKLRKDNPCSKQISKWRRNKC